MRGSISHGAKIRRRANQAATEMMQPDAVHQYARDEWVGAAGQPSRKSKPAPAGRDVGIFRWELDRFSARSQAWGREHTQPARQDGVFWLVVIAAMKQIRDRHLVRGFSQRADEILFWFARANLGDFRIHRFQI